MKKIVYLIGVLILASSCTCVLSQIPPQTVYADVNCEALLPDYTPQVMASDNCGQVVLTQSPEAGTLLTADSPALDVTITATDQFGNEAYLVVPVALIDTIPHILEWFEGVATLDEEDVVNAYMNWEQMIKVHGIAKWIYDQSWKPDTLEFAEGVEEQLWYFTHSIALDSTEYQEYLSYKNQ